MIGREINGYHVVEKLGEGGMADVYKAIDLKLEREVAIKFLRPNSKDTKRSRQRFEVEAKALAKLRHPNIVAVLAYGEFESRPYLVMDYIPGGTLKSQLGKPMSWKKAASLLVPVARALHYAHGKNIIHRDVKPSNILITEEGEPMLSDFGVAKILGVEETLDLTTTNVGVGTPYYMSPEQGRNEEIGPQSDIYSLGVVLYEMVTGVRPFEAETPLAVVLKHIEAPIPLPTKKAQNLPANAEHIILRALAKDRKNRYASMAEMASALDKGSETGLSLPRTISSFVLPLAGVALLVLIVVLALQGRGLSAAEVEPSEVSTPSPIVGANEAIDISQIAFIASGGTGYSDLDIVFINANGSEFYSLFDHPGKNQVPSISPDGEKLAFVSDSDGDNDIYIFDTVSRDVEKLVDTPTTEWFPSWSPDGGQLAFVSDFSGTSSVYVINDDGTGMQQVTDSPSQDWRPSWSPDGEQIVFQRGGHYEGANLYILTLDTGEIAPLTNDPLPVFNGNPAWSPLGDLIAFTSDINGNHDIFVVSADGSGRRAVSATQNNEDLASWSPDGSQIVFTIDLGSNNHEIFTIRSNGTGLTRLTNTPQMETEPVWMVHPRAGSASEQIQEIPAPPREGSYLVLEDFNDQQVNMVGFSTDSSLWQIVSDETENPVFEVNNIEEDYIGFSFGMEDWENYVVRYRVRFLADPGALGIQVRSSGQFYYVIELSTGELYLAYPEATGWERIVTTHPPIRIGEWHSVRVVAFNDLVQVYVDDNLWISENDSRVSRGWIHMFAWAGTRAQIDDIEVLELE